MPKKGGIDRLAKFLRSDWCCNFADSGFRWFWRFCFTFLLGAIIVPCALWLDDAESDYSGCGAPNAQAITMMSAAGAFSLIAIMHSLFAEDEERPVFLIWHPYTVELLFATAALLFGAAIWGWVVTNEIVNNASCNASATADDLVGVSWAITGVGIAYTAFSGAFACWFLGTVIQNANTIDIDDDEADGSKGLTTTERATIHHAAEELESLVMEG